MDYKIRVCGKDSMPLLYIYRYANRNGEWNREEKNFYIRGILQSVSKIKLYIRGTTECFRNKTLSKRN